MPKRMQIGDRANLTVGKHKAGEHQYPRVILTSQLEALGIQPGDEVLVILNSDSIVIKPTSTKAPS